MMKERVGVLELGSNSLKYHRIERSADGSFEIDSHKSPWKIAHDFYRTGEFSQADMEAVLSTLRSVEAVSGQTKLHQMLSVATGVFRDLPATEELAQQMKSELGLRLRIISGRDEALLMAKGSRKRSGKNLLCDVGGSTTEWAQLHNGSTRNVGSVPLGAIRNHQAIERSGQTSSEFFERSVRFCQPELKKLPRCDQLIVTGGTAKSLAGFCGGDRISIDRLRSAITSTMSLGPPGKLPTERREVFLAGLIILDQLATLCAADSIIYEKSGVGSGVAGRIASLLEKNHQGSFRETMMLQTRSFR